MLKKIQGNENVQNLRDKTIINDGEKIPKWKSEISFNIPKYTVQQNYLFQNLKQILFKLFINKTFDYENIKMTSFEKTILNSILTKKRFIIDGNRELDKTYLFQLANNPPTKSKEINLKYVIPKCFKYLKKQLENEYFRQLIDSKWDNSKLTNNKNYHFFMHYFGHISRKEDIPIEKFFIFRNWTHRFNQNIPKTITLNSFKLWRKNPDFITKIRNYLQFQYIKEIQKINRNKVEALINKWVLYTEKNGVQRMLKYVQDSMKLKGTKLPWTIIEAVNALKVTLKILK